MSCRLYEKCKRVSLHNSITAKNIDSHVVQLAVFHILHKCLFFHFFAETRSIFVSVNVLFIIAPLFQMAPNHFVRRHTMLVEKWFSFVFFLLSASQVFLSHGYQFSCVFICILAYSVRTTFSEAVIFCSTENFVHSLSSHATRMSWWQFLHVFVQANGWKENVNDFKVNHAISKRMCAWDLQCFFTFASTIKTTMAATTIQMCVYLIPFDIHLLGFWGVRFVFVFVILFSRCLFFLSKDFFFAQ